MWLSIGSGVVSTMLIECNRILDPLIPNMDEVDIDVFPIIIMTMVNTKWITSLLMTIPDIMTLVKCQRKN